VKPNLWHYYEEALRSVDAESGHRQVAAAILAVGEAICERLDKREGKTKHKIEWKLVEFLGSWQWYDVWFDGKHVGKYQAPLQTILGFMLEALPNAFEIVERKETTSDQ